MVSIKRKRTKKRKELQGAYGLRGSRKHGGSENNGLTGALRLSKFQMRDQGKSPIHSGRLVDRNALHFRA